MCNTLEGVQVVRQQLLQLLDCHSPVQRQTSVNNTKRSLLCMPHPDGVSGQAVQPKPLASLKLSMAVYGQKLDGRPSR